MPQGCHPSSNIVMSFPFPFSLNNEIPGATTAVNCSVSNMAAKTLFAPPWLFSSLDKSGVKNGLALIGKI